MSLAEVVDSVAATPPLDRAHLGVEVYDPEARRVLARRNADSHFVPASNMKLVIAALALEELGGDFRFSTPVYALGGAGDAAGALLVVGRGDPSLSERYFPGEFAGLDSIADSVAVRGIRRVGGIVIDASRFDRQRVPGSWPVGNLAWGYGAGVEAFGAGEGTYRVVLTPGGRAGDPAGLQVLEPRGPFTIVNRAVTGSPGTGVDFEPVLVPGTDTLIVAASIGVGAAPDTTRLAVPEPAAFAGAALAQALRRRGVAVSGDVRVVYDTVAARALAEGRSGVARALVTWRSPPVRTILARFMKPSRNWHAEMLLKAIAAEKVGQGSWPAGLSLARRYLIDRVGVDSAAIALRDASGLSPQNLVTPHALVQLLDYARRQPWAADFRAALPQPGERGGTLSGRLQDLGGGLVAKTGSIGHVDALSGYARAADGRELIFSILSNASGISSGQVRRAIDRIVRAVAAERTGS